MSFNNLLHSNFKVLCIVSLVLFLLPAALFSQISLTIGESSGEVGDSLVPLDVHISNLSDSIAAFQIWLQMGQPDIITFQQAYDTASFVVPNWSVALNSLGGLNNDILVTAVYKITDPVYIVPPQNDDLLIRLYLKVADSFILTPEDSTVNIYLLTDLLSHFTFTNTSGGTIGLVYEEILDTSCFVCTAWDGDICLNYMQVPLPNSCDSIAIDTTTSPMLDPAFWQFTNGSFTLLPTCGVVSSAYDISKLVQLVDYMFGGGPEVTLEDADCNCDCAIDIADLICFIDYMFNSGLLPGCETH